MNKAAPPAGVQRYRKLRGDFRPNRISLCVRSPIKVGQGVVMAHVVPPSQGNALVVLTRTHRTQNEVVFIRYSEVPFH